MWSTLQNFFTPSFITMQNLVVVTHTVSVHVGPTNVVDAGALPLGWECVMTLWKHAPPPRVLPHFVALGQTVWAQVWGPKNLEDHGMTQLTPRTIPN